MLKVLLIATPADQLPSLEKDSVVTTVAPGSEALSLLNKSKYDLVVVADQAALLLNQALLSAPSARRMNVMASTHQGIQLVPISEVYYFQAEHKYVVTYHSQGQLLIDDSLDKLGDDFADYCIRIHRKTLVVISKIERLINDEPGEHYIKLRNSAVKLPVSRRQLSKVRKLLLCM